MSRIVPSIGKIVYEHEAVEGVEYRPHPEFQNYAIGNDGSVWMCSHGTIERMSESPSGPGNYWAVGLAFDGKKRHVTVHTLVLETFVGPRPDNMSCRHLDGNKDNNHISNLKWGTAWEQARDKELHGVNNKGSRNGQAKLTEKIVREIKAMLNGGASSEAVAEKFGVSGATVNRVANNVIWSHVDLPPCNAKSRYCRGETSPNAKLNAAQVLEIVERSKNGERYIDIAAAYGVSSGLVGFIVRGKAWSHVTGIGCAT